MKNKEKIKPKFATKQKHLNLNLKVKFSAENADI